MIVTAVASSYIAYVRTPLWKAALLSYRLPQGMIVTTVASSYIASILLNIFGLCPSSFNPFLCISSRDSARFSACKIPFSK